MGVVFFILNAIFAAVLLIMVLVSTCFAVLSKNPDTRYQPMRDDRGSFIKSATQLNTELDALGATARGDMVQTFYKNRDFDDDADSFSSDSGRMQQDASSVPLPPSTAASHRSPSRHRDSREVPRSPVDPSMPLFPSTGEPRHDEPIHYEDGHRGLYSGYHNESSRPGVNLPLLDSWSNTGHSTPRSQDRQMLERSGSPQSYSGYRQQNDSSPWQRGAGYSN